MTPFVYILLSDAIPSRVQIPHVLAERDVLHREEFSHKHVKLIIKLITSFKSVREPVRHLETSVSLEVECVVPIILGYRVMLYS